MTEANNRASRERNESTASSKQGSAGQTRRDSDRKRSEQKNSQRKNTQSIKYVKLEKERPSLTRAGVKTEPQKSGRRRGSNARKSG